MDLKHGYLQKQDYSNGESNVMILTFRGMFKKFREMFQKILGNVNFIERHKNHVSILRIKDMMQQRSLSFSCQLTAPQISNYIKNFDRKKASEENDIPVNLARSKWWLKCLRFA